MYHLGRKKYNAQETIHTKHQGQTQIIYVLFLLNPAVKVLLLDILDLGKFDSILDNSQEICN